jgi:hypothetical protein
LNITELYSHFGLARLGTELWNSGHTPVNPIFVSPIQVAGDASLLELTTSAIRSTAIGPDYKVFPSSLFLIKEFVYETEESFKALCSC